MTIVLDNNIVPSGDKETAAKFFAHIFGLSCRDGVAFRARAGE